MNHPHCPAWCPGKHSPAYDGHLVDLGTVTLPEGPEMVVSLFRIGKSAPVLWLARRGPNSTEVVQLDLAAAHGLYDALRAGLAAAGVQL